jgi:hypothetical protein
LIRLLSNKPARFNNGERGESPGHSDTLASRVQMPKIVVAAVDIGCAGNNSQKQQTIVGEMTQLKHEFRP